MASIKPLKHYEVAAFRVFCERKGYVIVSQGPKEFVFIAGKHGTQTVPIEPKQGTKEAAR